MSIKEAKSVYCLGIGGIGVSGLARLFLAMGKQVFGSDLKRTEITDGLEKLGIKISIGSNQVSGNPDLVLYTPAVPEEDLNGITHAKLSQGEAIGELMADYYGVAVTGTNGKSTTTAILGLILEQAGLDPTVLVGANLSSKNESEKFRANARLGRGKYLVVESDEYQKKMLQNRPQMIVVTNIAEDHLDCYKDLDDIKQAFGEYIRRLPPDGILIYNADDHNSVEVCRHATCHKFTFGIHHYADLQALNVKTENGRQNFDLHLNDEKIGSTSLQVPGLFNVSNALAASLAAIKLGVKAEVLEKAVADFGGIWRRFEKVGELEGKTVISDYAHHPAGIEATLAAAKDFFSGKKILTVFQPHQRNRTKSLFNEFVNSLLEADEVIISEIFDVAGREHGEQISSRDLVNELRKQKEKAVYAPNLDEAEKLIRERLPGADVVLLMGAGDIDSLARKLVK